MTTFRVTDRSDNLIVYVGTHRELYALVRTLRSLNPEADELFYVVAIDGDGDETRYMLGGVLRGDADA